MTTASGRDNYTDLKRLYYYSFRFGLYHFVSGLEFYRCQENYWILSRLLPVQSGAPLRILDIGPWRSLLPAYLTSRGHVVETVDLAKGHALQESYRRRAGLSTDQMTNHVVELQPPDDISYALPDATFDAVISISTIEHFPAGGDSRVISEVARLLKPGGRAILTVPYGPSYDEHRHGRWFERTYDHEALRTRLVEPSGLDWTEELYFKDFQTLRFTRLYWKIPKRLRQLLGRLWLPVFLRLARRDAATRDDASLTGLVLTKTPITRGGVGV